MMNVWPDGETATIQLLNGCQLMLQIKGDKIYLTCSAGGQSKTTTVLSQSEALSIGDHLTRMASRM